MSKENDEDLNPKDRGLGRGLGALFGDEEESYPHYDAEIDVPDHARKTVGIEQLFPCKTQPRKKFDDKALKELSSSILEHGLLQPILVRPDHTREGMYEIIAGERRWRASQKAQLHEVPIIIRDLDEAETFKIALVENIQREDLNPMEECVGFCKLEEDYGMSHDEIGETIGKSRSYVSNIMRLSQLNAPVQTMLRQGDISTGHARALIGLPGDEASHLATRIKKEKLSVREIEELSAAAHGRDMSRRNERAKVKSGIAKKDADTLALEREVSNKLGMNVSINMKDAHKGAMQIDFKNLDQLDDVLQRLAQTPKY